MAGGSTRASMVTVIADIYYNNNNGSVIRLIQ